MTLFDLIAVLLLGVSALVGFANGAVREVVGLFAFAIAAAAAVFLLPLTGPLGRAMFHPHWAGNAAAIAVSFVVAYIALKLAGRWLTLRLRDTGFLGSFDRAGGAVVGIVRGLILLGVFYLGYNALTPAELRAQKGGWIESATLYPLARASGQALQRLTPDGMAAAGKLGPAMRNAMFSGDENGVELSSDRGLNVTADEPDAASMRRERTRSEQTQGKKHDAGYGRRERQSLDGLVERTR